MSPKIVDAIYRNRENRRFCKEHGIRMSGPGLGRPPKPTQENEAELRALADQARQDELDRIPVEGKFGEGKRRYGLGRVMTKLACTSETGIMLTFLVMNLKKWLAAIFLRLFLGASMRGDGVFGSGMEDYRPFGVYVEGDGMEKSVHLPSPKACLRLAFFEF